MKHKVVVSEYNSGNFRRKSDFVVNETSIQLNFNNNEMLQISICPTDLKAFTYGFLFTSGFITSIDQVKSLQISEGKIDLQAEIHRKNIKKVLPASCTGSYVLEAQDNGTDNENENENDNENAKGHREPFNEKLIPDFKKLIPLFNEFNKSSILFQETGGVHSAAISDGESVNYFSEDIGRHNAIDKTIGKALLEKVDLNRYFLLTSGRISAEIVKKSFNARIRTIVSRAAPSFRAIQKAKEHNMTIIGFLRGEKCNIYT